MVLAGGGTGGHVYPSLAVARALEREVAARGDTLDLLYIGVRGRVDETIVPRQGVPFRAVAAGPLRVASPVAFASNMLRLALGLAQSLAILLRFRPRVVFATGGYASVPVGAAARLLRRPLVVYLPDVTPGWAVRLLAKLATRVTTTSEAALVHLPAAKTTVVGYPVRDAFWNIDRTEARARYGAGAGPLLVVTGASLGARAINDAIFEALPALLPTCAIMHVTGGEDHERAELLRARLPQEQRARYIPRPYIDEMPAALVAADLVVSRAGASTLGELPAAGVPSILVPGEYEGWSQAPNAEFLVARGAALMLRNADLGRLAQTVLDLFAAPARLAQMRESARALARPDAARDLARIVLEVAA